MTILIYIGPGMSGGLFAAVLGILISLFMSLFAILWYPFKKIYRKFRGSKEIAK